MEAIVQNFFNVEIMARVLPYLLTGLGVTLLLSMLVVPLGLTGGLAVAVLYSLRLRWISVLVIAYVDFFRAFPPLVLLLFLYFGLPFFGVDIPAIVAVALGFLLNTSAYSGEIFRAGIDSIAPCWIGGRAVHRAVVAANDGIHHRTAGDEITVLPDLVKCAERQRRRVAGEARGRVRRSEDLGERDHRPERRTLGDRDRAVGERRDRQPHRLRHDDVDERLPAVMPVERAASYCPFGMETIPAQKISSAKAPSTSESESHVAVKALIGSPAYGTRRTG